MNDQSETPKKISPDQVQVLGVGAHSKADHAKSNDQGLNAERGDSPFVDASTIFTNSKVKVFKSGPLGALLFLPLTLILLPVLILGFLGVMFLAMLFGRSIFKIVKFRR